LSFSLGRNNVGKRGFYKEDFVSLQWQKSIQLLSFFNLTLSKYFCHLVLGCYRILPFLIGKTKWQKKCDYHGNDREYLYEIRPRGAILYNRFLLCIAQPAGKHTT